MSTYLLPIQIYIVVVCYHLVGVGTRGKTSSRLENNKYVIST